MPLNISGPLSLAGAISGQSIALELSQAPIAQISLNDTIVRTLANIPTGAIRMPADFYGKSAVIPGLTGTVNFTVGTGGTGGTGAVSGSAGGTTTVTYTPRSLSLTANGGGGGLYNSSTNATGGTASGGSINSTGGTGRASTGDSGGGGGGGIGGSNATHNGVSAGDDGAVGLSVANMFTFLIPSGTAGLGSPAGSSAQPNNGAAATAIGSGGGGAGYWGGDGGAGYLGGGGGGASGYTARSWIGGQGGSGFVLLALFNGNYYTVNIYTTTGALILPASIMSFKAWAVGGGGGGAGSPTIDSTSGGGGGAGGVAYAEAVY